MALITMTLQLPGIHIIRSGSIDLPRHTLFCWMINNERLEANAIQTLG